MQTQILADLPMETAKLTPPVAAMVSGATSQELIAVLTVIYLIVLLAHKFWSWRNEHGDRRDRRSGEERRKNKRQALDSSEPPVDYEK